MYRFVNKISSLILTLIPAELSNSFKHLFSDLFTFNPLSPFWLHFLSINPRLHATISTSGFPLLCLLLLYAYDAPFLKTRQCELNLSSLLWTYNLLKVEEKNGR